MTKEQLFEMDYQERWDYMLATPNYFVDNEGFMDCNENCDHLEWCFICS